MPGHLYATPAGFATDVKPQFGSLVQFSHKQTHSGGGNIVLDLNKLKNAAGYVPRGNERQQIVVIPHELCTIEESKRSEPLHDSESYYNNAGPISQTIEAASGHTPNNMFTQGSFQRPGSSGSAKQGLKPTMHASATGT
jgi:hypothetical protein